MTFEARLSDNFAIDGLDIYIALKDGPDSRRILRIHGPHAIGWEELEPQTATEPTLSLPGEAARALLDVLLRHYEGASDVHTVRSDLLHERGRVDSLMNVLARIAEAARR